MTMLEHFSPEAARGLPGPELAGRAPRRAPWPRLADVAWPTASEEIWRYSRIGELDLGRFRPVPADQMGEPGDEPAPGGGPIAAEAGERSALVVVRNGRVVHHALDPELEAKGVRVCGIATCDADELASLLGTCSDASPDAFTMLHDAFLAGGAFVKVPRGVVVERPIVVLHWSEGDGLASFPHTLVVAEEGAEVTVFDRYGSTDTGPGTTGHLVDAVVELIVGDNAHVRYLSVQEHGPRTWQIALQRAHLGPRRDAEVVGGGAGRRVRAPAQRVAARRLRRRVRPHRGLLRRRRPDARLPHPPGPRRAQHPQRPPVQGRGGGHRAVGVLRAHPHPPRRAEVGGVPDQPQPGAHRGRGGEVGAEPRDRGRRREVLARRARSGRSTTISSTTWPRAGCRPRRPSASSCSGSSTTCSTGSRSRRWSRRCAAA